MAINFSGNFDCFVESVRPASPYTRLQCVMGGALLHVLRRHGNQTLAIGDLSSSPLQPQASTLAVPRGDLLVDGPRSGKQWYPILAGDLSEFDDALDTGRLRVSVTIVVGGGLAALQAWCEAFGGTFEAAPARPA